jgi:hypothetical protein
VRRHDLAFVCSSTASDLFPDLPPTLLQRFVAAHTHLIRLSRTHSQSSRDPNCRSNPIAHRVRRKRQRLPPSLLIENASDRLFPKREVSCPRRFRSRLATNRPTTGGVRPRTQNNCWVYADSVGVLLQPLAETDNEQESGGSHIQAALSR